MSKKKRTGSFSPAGNGKKRQSGIVLSAMSFAKRPTNGMRLVEEYKKAGYDIFGTTRDGVVIVKPSGTPDSFDLNQLDRAFSQANSKNWR